MSIAGTTSSISGNVRIVNERIAAAAGRSGRSRDAVTLLAATKTVAPELIREGVAAGISAMGENRIQEAADKIPALHGVDIDWHFIGHLQSNKARQAVRLFPTIQSVDSVELARTLQRVASDEGKWVRVLLEVNTSGEPSKHGFAPTEVERAALEIQSMSALEIEGLMTIGPLTNDAHETRQSFRLLKGLQDQLAARYTDSDWDTLSMGMTDDFEIAVEEGSTLVRVGRAIFGARS
jgi:PLP dependent protein